MHDLFPCSSPLLLLHDDLPLLLSAPRHISMEERPEQPSHGGDHRPSSSSTSLVQSPRISNQGNSTESLPIIQISDQSNFFSSGTYVVQVPRDQVYRVPPPENSILVDNYRRDHQEGRNSSCCGSYSYPFIILVIIIFLITGAIVGICLAIFLIYDNPGFSIDHFLVKKKTSLHHKQSLEYDIKMKVHNPNKYHAISYNQDPSNTVSLSSNRKELASGKFPDFDQASEDSTIVDVTMHGSTNQLPRVIATNMNSTHSRRRISLSLSILNVPVKLKIGALNVKSRKIDVSCSFLVDRFDKDARVVTQECITSG